MYCNASKLALSVPHDPHRNCFCSLLDLLLYIEIIVCQWLVSLLVCPHSCSQYQDAKQRKEAMHKFHFSAM